MIKELNTKHPFEGRLGLMGDIATDMQNNIGDELPCIILMSQRHGSEWENIFSMHETDKLSVADRFASFMALISDSKEEAFELLNEFNTDALLYIESKFSNTGTAAKNGK